MKLEVQSILVSHWLGCGSVWTVAVSHWLSCDVSLVGQCQCLDVALSHCLGYGSLSLARLWQCLIGWVVTLFLVGGL